jgi:hypothetical protein
MLSEWQLEIPGVVYTSDGPRRPFLKGHDTLPGPYDTGRLERSAAKKQPTGEQVELVLLNTESTDAGSVNFTAALAESIRAIHKATGAKVTPYWHFHWGKADARTRWNRCRAAFAEAGAWPSHIVVSGHWRDARQVKDLIDRIEAEIAVIRAIEPYAPIAVLTCRWRYADKRLEHDVVMAELSRRIAAMGCDEIQWLEAKHATGAKE